MSTRLERRIVRKTANYTLRPPFDRPGTVFTNAGATGAVTFTLPTPNRAVLGWWFRFKAVADQNLLVAAPTADTLVTLDDVAADSIALSTADQIVGGEIEAVCVETSAGVYQWAASGIAVGHTYTVATA
jgi:hypothetical protein